MKKYIQKAGTLVEALPYIRQFYGKTVVIKYGGAAMAEDHLKTSFAIDAALMKYVGINPVIVHGGGPQISRFLSKLNITTEFKKGQRVTDEATMDVVEMVLVGKVNKEIVALINREGGRAVGLSGKDGGLIRAKKLHLYEESVDGRPPELIDLGMVGEVVGVDPLVIGSLESAKFIPIIAPVGVGEKGETYNINADTVAGKLAQALGAVKLILLTDVDGLMDSSGRLVSSVNLKEARRMLKEGDVSGGMIPKLSCCVEAVEEGVDKAHILDGRVEHVILLELFTDSGVGTEVVP